MNTLRIVWLLPTAWFYWQPCLSELSKSFTQTKVFAGLFPGFAKGFENSIDIEVVGDRKVLALTSSATSYGDNFTCLSPKIVPKLFAYKPDVIFSSSFGVWTLLALFFKLIGGWKVVIAYEGSSPGVDYRHSILRLTFRRMMIQLADACITNSHGGKDYLVNVLNTPADQVFVQPYEVPDGRSLTTTSSPALSSPSSFTFDTLQHPVFMFVGSIIPRKGVQCLVEACKQLKATMKNPFTVLIVGEGDQRAELQHLSHVYGLDDEIQWVGRVDYSALGTYFHHADVFVLPTLEDTWGMVVLEAMLLGKPIICSKGAGASELIEDGQNGYAFIANDAEDLASKMQHFIQAPHRIRQMGQYSKDTMDRYTPKAAAEMMSEVIEYVTAP